MGVYDTGKLQPSFVSVKKFSPDDQEAMYADMYSRGSQESSDYLQDLRIAF